MRDDPNARRAIEGLLKRLSPAGLQIDRWPDQLERTRPEIDAIAGPYAIEHTLVETFPRQFEDSVRFNQLAALEAELALPYRLAVSVPVGALARGQDWSAIVGRVKQWIIERSPELPVSPFAVSVSIEDVPFTLTVWRTANSESPGLFFSRLDPGADGFVQSLTSLATRKIEKLVRYQKAGLTTILLLETRDIALMSPRKMEEGLSQGFPGGFPSGVDQVWLADWSCESVPSYWRFAQYGR